MSKRHSICILLILFLFLFAGCGEKDLAVGYIDVDQMLVRCDKFKSYGEQYAQDQAEFFKKFPKEPSQMSAKEREEYTAANQEMKDKWEKIKLGIRDEIKDAAKETAQKQKLDLILDNSSSSPTVEYGGKNVTKDVQKAVEASGEKKK